MSVGFVKAIKRLRNEGIIEKLELRRGLTSALDGERVLVFTMLLRFGVYTAYCCGWRCAAVLVGDVSKIDGSRWWGALGLSERRCGASR